MVLMRRLLLDAQAKFRKMMADNQALAHRIDRDIHSAHLQVSELRAELADIRDMAGNVITTCMPPTATTNSAAVSSTAEWGVPAPSPPAPAPVPSAASPPIADKGGTVQSEQPRAEGGDANGGGKHKLYRRERRSLKGGGDIQKSILDDLRSQEGGEDLKVELQRSESDGNQNSAPECDLSIGSNSPFKENKAEAASPSKKPPEQKEPDAAGIDLHRNSPPIRDDSSAQHFSPRREPSPCRTKADSLDKIAQEQQHPSPGPSPGAVAKQKSSSSETPTSRSAWYKNRETSSSLSGRSFVEDSSSKEETSDSQEGPSSDFSERRLPKPDAQGRHLVFDSRDIRRPYRPWRSPLSGGEGYRDPPGSPWRSDDASDKPKQDEKAQPAEKDESPFKGYPRKSANVDYSGYNSTPRTQEDLVAEIEALKIKNSALLRDLEEVMESRDDKAKENSAMAAKLDHSEKELKHAKEALSALKQDRKRLKAEKFDLLTQMKQLYSTLEDKEEELREFIRNYEHKMKENDENMKQMAKEREEMEQEKWSILKRARDEAERAVLLCTQIGLKDAHIKELQEELGMMQEKRQSGDVRQTNGYGSPGSVSFRTANGIDSRGSPTPTPGSDPRTSPSYAGTPTIASQYADSASPHKGPSSQGVSPEHRPSLLSRSAEDIFNSEGMSSPKKKSKEKKSTWGSISRVFSRTKRRKPLDPDLFDNNRCSWSPKSSACSSPLNEESYVQKLRLLEETHGTPMQHWRAATVLAWLEITMDMPQYATLCSENIKSGKVLLELSESELEEGLGITNVMHRRKLRLAIEEHRQPSLCRYPKICLMTHSWVVEEWLPSIALTCYLPSFSEHLVDGRVLDTLTKKDLEKHFGITRKFHLLSIMHAIQLLRMLNFDRQILNQRRLNSDTMDVDPLVWTNQRLIKWAASVDLAEYAENLRNTGVHGALAVLEPSFTADTIATALGIPTSKNIIRRHLTTEWQNLIQPARLSLESESVVAKKSKSEKRLASGSSSISLASQGRGGSGNIVSSYARRTLDRCDRRRSSWRFSTWKSSQESLKSTSSKKLGPAAVAPTASSSAERPRLLPLSPNSTRHRRTFSSHSDVEALTVTPV